jgi:hypothetical protein
MNVGLRRCGGDASSQVKTPAAHVPRFSAPERNSRTRAHARNDELAVLRRLWPSYPMSPAPGITRWRCCGCVQQACFRPLRRRARRPEKPRKCHLALHVSTPPRSRRRQHACATRRSKLGPRSTADSCLVPSKQMLPGSRHCSGGRRGCGTGERHLRWRSCSHGARSVGSRRSTS